uniref:Tick defensin n=1 Tax=Rhipicephalus appendiculatus TaxID=34631 RepID=A0A131Z6T5_RHIAP
MALRESHGLEDKSSTTMPVNKFPLLLMLTLIIMVENVSNRRMNPPGPDCVGLPCSRPNDPWCGPHCFCFRRAGGLPECKARRRYRHNSKLHQQRHGQLTLVK